MTYRVEFTGAAARQTRKLPRFARDKVLAAVTQLQHEPRPRGARKLVGTDNAWCIRIGDYRVIYEILDYELLVTVVRAGHRREVYSR